MNNCIATLLRLCVVIFITIIIGAVSAPSANADWERRVNPLKQTNVQMSEGLTTQPYLLPNDFRGRHSIKHLNAVALYVSFPNSNTPPSVEMTKARLIGGTDIANEFSRFFDRQSDGQFTIEIDHQPNRKLMPREVEHYRNSYYDYTTHRAFIQDAINLFPGVNFDAFDIVVVVPAHSNGALRGASNLTDNRGHELVQRTNGSRIRRYVTMGDGLYNEQKPVRILLHEIGHLFGFPDLYPYVHHWEPGRYTDADYSLAGSWGIMSDSVRARDYLEWHRFKAGWLPESNTAYVTGGSSTFTLSYWPLRMVVIPIDDVTNPTSAYIIQRTPTIDSSNYTKIHGGRGVIIYKVFSDRATGEHPIEVKLPSAASGRHSRDFGNRYQAVFHQGRKFDNNHGITVEVKSEEVVSGGSDYQVTVAVSVDRGNLRDELRKRSVVSEMEIGAQTWTAENLNIVAGNSVCYSNIGSNCGPYGRLYSYEAAQDACSSMGGGWDLPTDKDWLELSNRLGGAYGTNTRDGGNSAYRALAPGGSTGFEAQFGGKFYFFDDTRKGYFYDQSEIGYFWTSSLSKTGDVISYTMRKSDTKLLRENITQQSKVSVRCIRRNASPVRQRGDTTLQ